eukprot:gene6524-8334_t
MLTSDYRIRFFDHVMFNLFKRGIDQFVAPEDSVVSAVHSNGVKRVGESEFNVNVLFSSFNAVTAPLVEVVFLGALLERSLHSSDLNVAVIFASDSEYSLQRGNTTIVCGLRHSSHSAGYRVNALLVQPGLFFQLISNLKMSILRCPMMGTGEEYLELIRRGENVSVEVLRGAESLVNFTVPWRSRKTGLMLSQSSELNDGHAWGSSNVGRAPSLNLCVPMVRIPATREKLQKYFTFIEHHLNIGVGHIYMTVSFEWDSEHVKRLLQVLKPYIQSGYLTVLTSSPLRGVAKLLKRIESVLQVIKGVDNSDAKHIIRPRSDHFLPLVDDTRVAGYIAQTEVITELHLESFSVGVVPIYSSKVCDKNSCNATANWNQRANASTQLWKSLILNGAVNPRVAHLRRWGTLERNNYTEAQNRSIVDVDVLLKAKGHDLLFVLPSRSKNAPVQFVGWTSYDQVFREVDGNLEKYKSLKIEHFTERSLRNYSELPVMASDLSDLFLGAILERDFDSDQLQLTTFMLCHAIVNNTITNLGARNVKTDMIPTWQRALSRWDEQKYRDSGDRAFDPQHICRVSN